MNPTAAEVLVVAESAEPNAETDALVETVRLLATRDDVAVRVLLFRGGDRLVDLEAHAPTTVVERLERTTVAAVMERLAFAVRLRHLGLRLRGRRLGLRPTRAGQVVFLSTVLGVQVLRYLSLPGPRVVCRLSEQAVPLPHSLNAADLELLVARVDQFLAVTPAGAAELVDDHGVAPSRVQRFPESIVVGDPAPDGASPSRSPSAEARAALGLSPTATVIGSFGAGAADDPPDLVVLLARLLAPRLGLSEVEVEWVVPAATSQWLEHDVRRAGVDDWVHVRREVEDSTLHLAACDILVLMSWFDSCPREYLDGAARGVPVVCFAGTELAEVIGDDQGGFVVPYLDLELLADRVAALVRDPVLRAEKGLGAIGRVRAAHGVEHSTAVLLVALRAVGP